MMWFVFYDVNYDVFLLFMMLYDVICDVCYDFCDVIYGLWCVLWCVLVIKWSVINKDSSSRGEEEIYLSALRWDHVVWLIMGILFILFIWCVLYVLWCDVWSVLCFVICLLWYMMWCMFLWCDIWSVVCVLWCIYDILWCFCDPYDVFVIHMMCYIMCFYVRGQHITTHYLREIDWFGVIFPRRGSHPPEDLRILYKDLIKMKRKSAIIVFLPQNYVCFYDLWSIFMMFFDVFVIHIYDVFMIYDPFLWCVLWSTFMCFMMCLWFMMYMIDLYNSESRGCA